MHFVMSAARGRALLAATALQLFLTSRVLAGGPTLAFDFPRTIECQAIEREALADDVVGQRARTVRCVVPLSVRLLAGDIGNVREIRVEIGDCDRRLQVASIAPATRLENTLADHVEWSKTHETSKTFAASLGGEAPVPLGDVVAHVTPTVSGGFSNREVVTQRERRLPPKQVVVVSGTTSEGSGVFFNLRPTPQTSLEGMHELTIDFAVPEHWRGDALHVSVAATGEEKFLWMTQQKVWSQRQALIAVYIAEDAQARRAAEAFIRE